MHFSRRDGDFIARHFKKNGLFSVKSSYKLALSIKDRKEDEQQYSGVVLGKENFRILCERSMFLRRFRFSHGVPPPVVWQLR